MRLRGYAGDAEHAYTRPALQNVKGVWNKPRALRLMDSEN